MDCFKQINYTSSYTQDCQWMNLVYPLACFGHTNCFIYLLHVEGFLCPPWTGLETTVDLKGFTAQDEFE